MEGDGVVLVDRPLVELRRVAEGEEGLLEGPQGLLDAGLHLLVASEGGRGQRPLVQKAVERGLLRLREALEVEERETRIPQSQGDDLMALLGLVDLRLLAGLPEDVLQGLGRHLHPAVRRDDAHRVEVLLGEPLAVPDHGLQALQGAVVEGVPQAFLVQPLGVGPAVQLEEGELDAVVVELAVLREIQAEVLLLFALQLQRQVNLHPMSAPLPRRHADAVVPVATGVHRHPGADAFAERPVCGQDVAIVPQLEFLDVAAVVIRYGSAPTIGSADADPLRPVVEVARGLLLHKLEVGANPIDCDGHLIVACVGDLPHKGMPGVIAELHIRGGRQGVATAVRQLEQRHVFLVGALCVGVQLDTEARVLLHAVGDVEQRHPVLVVVGPEPQIQGAVAHPGTKVAQAPHVDVAVSAVEEHAGLGHADRLQQCVDELPVHLQAAVILDLDTVLLVEGPVAHQLLLPVPNFEIGHAAMELVDHLLSRCLGDVGVSGPHCTEHSPVLRPLAGVTHLPQRKLLDLVPINEEIHAIAAQLCYLPLNVVPLVIQNVLRNLHRHLLSNLIARVEHDGVVLRIACEVLVQRDADHGCSLTHIHTREQGARQLVGGLHPQLDCAARHDLVEIRNGWELAVGRPFPCPCPE
mmetsp:Transcript_33622/g.55254  ORF Transcript_33622/g.55254 Transcript_33622/m.55254 type:complete len:637 (-) Transcript_33622:881-2791(-)